MLVNPVKHFGYLKGAWLERPKQKTVAAGNRQKARGCRICGGFQ
jgi:hypothetical protein